MVVYAQEPRILNKLSKNVKTLEVGDKISESGYKVSFTVEKKEKEKDFSTFGETLIYNRQHAKPFRVTKLKKNLDNLNATPVSFTKAFSLEDVLSKVSDLKERLESFTKVFTHI